MRDHGQSLQVGGHVHLQEQRLTTCRSNVEVQTTSPSEHRLHVTRKVCTKMSALPRPNGSGQIRKVLPSGVDDLCAAVNPSRSTVLCPTSWTPSTVLPRCPYDTSPVFSPSPVFPCRPRTAEFPLSTKFSDRYVDRAPRSRVVSSPRHRSPAYTINLSQVNCVGGRPVSGDLCQVT